MSILVKPYEISVWKDWWDSTEDNGKGKFVEKRIGVIGSDKMIYQGRALEPTLTRNINGTKKLSFKMYKYFIDNITGEKITNEFSDWLISERKVKLLYEGKWFDFIIKDINENSSNYLYTYSLEDALVQELSKNGFGVTLDEQLRNNMGDVEYLATETLKETDWTIESEKFVERVDEALVYVQLPANDESTDESIKSWWKNTTIHKLKDDEEDFLQEGLEDSEVTDKSAFYKATILAFYSSCRNKPHRFQFIYLTNYSKANVSIDKNRQILNKNCQYYIEFDPSEYTAVNTTYDFVLPAGFSVIEKTYLNGANLSDSTISTWYRGGRYGFAQRAFYIPLLDRYCQVYQGPEYDDPTSETNKSKEYYGYMENLYNEPQFGMNLVTNTEFFNTSGWTATYNAGGSSSDKAVVENVYGKFINNKFVSTMDVLAGTADVKQTFTEFLNNTTNKCTPYMKIELKTGNSLVINSGPYDNRTIIKNMPVGSKWAFRAEYFSSTGGSTNLEFSIDEYTYDTTAGHYSAPSSKKITFTTTTNTDKDGNPYTIYTVNTNNFEDEIDFTKNCKLKIAISGKAGTYYIKNLEFFLVQFDKDDKVIPFDKQGEAVTDGIIAKKYRYFKPSELSTATEAKDIYYDCETDALSYNTYKPVYNTHGEKIRAVNAKESNYFNILQSIAETFECWLDLEIKRDNPNQPGAITGKIAKFKNYAGGDNYACFRYGVNLKDIQRTYSSKNIVTKLMVKQNSNEHGENGFCTIARAGANPTGDTSIYDFSYFQNMGLMDAHNYINTTYKIDGAEGPDACECLYSASENKPNLPLSFEKPGEEWHQEKQKDDKYVCSWKKTVTDEETTYTCVSTDAREIKDEYNLQGYFPRIRAINNQLLSKIDVEASAKQKLLALNADLEVQKTKQSAAASGMEESAELYLQMTGVQPTELVDGLVPISSITLDVANKYDCSNDEKKGHLSYWEKEESPGYTLEIATDLSDKTITITAKPSEGKEKFENTKTLSIVAYPILKTSVGTEIVQTLYFTLRMEQDKAEAIAEEQEVKIDTSASQIQKYFNEYATYAQEKHEADIKVPELESDIAEKQAAYDSLVATIDAWRGHKTALNKLFFTLYSRFIQEGTWIDEEYYDDEKYYNDALSVMYNSCYPQVAYTINTYEVSQLPGYEKFNFDVGEKTWAEDGEFFGFDDNGYPKREEVIITEKSENLDDPSKNTNKVQNFKNQFQDLFQKITATVQQTQYSTGAYEKGVAEANAIAEDSTGFLRDAISQMAVNLDNPQVFSESTDKSSQLKIVDGKILIGERDPNTEKISWKTGLSSGGIAADLINTGRLNTSEIQIYGGDNPTFRWDAHGISAYDYTTFSNIISGINTKKFVRFDKCGIYGINGTADGSSWIPGQINGKTAAQEIDENATFALTWEGLKVTGNEGVTARIGKQDEYIMRVDKAGESEPNFSITNNGDVSIKGKITAIDGKIGGVDFISRDNLDYKNLVYNSNFTNGLDGWTIFYNANSHIGVEYVVKPTGADNEYAVEIQNFGIGGYPGIATPFLPKEDTRFKVGDVLTLSCKYMIPKIYSWDASDQTHVLAGVEIKREGRDTGLAYCFADPSKTDCWNLISCTYTITEEDADMPCHIRLWLNDGSEDANGSRSVPYVVYFTDIQLELNGQATSWTPNIEDPIIKPNLLTGTQDLSVMARYAGVLNAQAGTQFYELNATVSEINSQIGYQDLMSFDYTVESGEVYTLSFWARGDINDSKKSTILLHSYSYNSDGSPTEPTPSSIHSSWGDPSSLSHDGCTSQLSLESYYKRYWVTWSFYDTRDSEGSRKNASKQFLWRAVTTGNFSIYGVKLEKGHTMTDWCEDSIPASSSGDYSWEFSNKTGITMWNGTKGNGIPGSGESCDNNVVFKIFKDSTSDQNVLYLKGTGIFEGGTSGITAELKGEEGKLYSVDNLVFKAGDGFGVTTDGTIYANKGKIGDMEIGDIVDRAKKIINENLVENSQRLVSNNGYLITELDLVADHEFKNGEVYTVSFLATLGLKSGANNISDIKIYNTTDNCYMAETTVENYTTEELKKYTLSFVWNNQEQTGTKETVENNTLRIYFYNGSETFPTSSISNIKLEKGTTATEWCPSKKEQVVRPNILTGTSDGDGWSGKFDYKTKEFTFACPTGKDEGTYFSNQRFNLQPNTFYTLSFLVKTVEDKKADGWEVWIFYDGATGDGTKAILNVSSNTSTEYQKQILTFQTGENVSNCAIRFDCNHHPDTKEVEILVKEIKLEQNTTATSWDAEYYMPLNVSTENDFSWKFSPTEGMFMCQGALSSDYSNAVLAMYKPEGKSNYELFVKGHIVATSLSLGTNKIPATSVSGLSTIATTGDYKDLENKPPIPDSVADLTDGANVLYKEDVNVSTSTDKGITTQTITYNGHTYTTKTSSDGSYILTNVGVGPNVITPGQNTEGTYFCVSTDGLLIANNAVINGTIYATAGEFTGKISASGGYLGSAQNGWNIGDNGLIKEGPTLLATTYIKDPNSQSTGTGITCYKYEVWQREMEITHLRLSYQIKISKSSKPEIITNPVLDYANEIDLKSGYGLSKSDSFGIWYSKYIYWPQLVAKLQ